MMRIRPLLFLLGLSQGWSLALPSEGDAQLFRFGATRVRLGDGLPDHAESVEPWGAGVRVVTATDPELFQCPFLFTSDAGTMGLDEAEALGLRTYLLKGGFLWVDDSWGDAAWNQLAGEFGRVLPEYSIVDLSLDHPLFAIVYQVPRIPQIPSLRHWRTTGGGTSERGLETAEPQIRAILDDDGRILVLMSHNTDIADGWERHSLRMPTRWGSTSSSG